MKAVILLMDGLGDRPCRSLGGQTPLQAAHKPLFDRMATEGESGVVDVVAPGTPNGSDTGHLAILGYDPHIYYFGRGPFEALGAGIDLREGDIAFRCNFATIDREGMILDRRAGRISSSEAQRLAEDISGLAIPEYPDVKILFRPTIEHRGVLVIRGGALSDKVSDTDPHKTGVRVNIPEPLEDSTEAARTASIMKAFTEKTSEILENHPINQRRREQGFPPANVILLRGAGRFKQLPTINERYHVRGAVIAGGALYKGVCKAVGFDVVNVPTATGTYNTDLSAKVRAVVDSLKKYDLVFMHVKATDTASHDRQPAKKKEMIEKTSHAFTPIYEMGISEDLYVVVTGDHTTPSEIGEHRGDPVPIMFWGGDVRRDRVEKFDEVSCAAGCVGRIRGVDVMKLLCNYLGTVEMYGE
ncbi:hypothetical protein HRbin01_00925 [archaeon HR01]|nr:hypothetical protein HRbin01_00925 [archaeon HR01]